jgi:hypothetical protein
MPVNPVLLKLARQRVWRQASAAMAKTAFQPPEGGGGAPPPDPSMMGGGAPPPDPSMMGGGGAPPPGGPGGAPMGMAPPPAAPMSDPSMMGMAPGTPGAAGMGQAAGPQKLKPDQLMMMLDYRMYNLQQQITAVMNALDIKLPPSALIMPPGQPGAPPAESALPGGANDATGQAGGQAGGGQSAIQPIEPMQGASPELAQGGGGGAPKAASWSGVGGPINRDMAPSEADPLPAPVSLGAAALSAIYRSRARAGQPVV